MNKITLKDKIKSCQWFSKLKKIKHIDLIVIVIFSSVLLLIYFSDFSSIKNSDNIQENETQTFTSYMSYTNDLETRLSNILKNVKGVGKVNVMITLTASPELVIAYNTQEKNRNGGLTDTQDSTIIVKEPVIITKNGVSHPIILTEILPEIKGVIIVAQGADNVAVKLNILSATKKLLDISANKIEIFAGE